MHNNVLMQVLAPNTAVSDRIQGSTNYGRQVAVATKSCTVGPQYGTHVIVFDAQNFEVAFVFSEQPE
jgi:hypothetical protein